MKRTQLKDTYKNIIKRVVSWLSIITIVFLGISGILGIQSAAYSRGISTNEFYAGHNYKDLDMFSNLGVTNDDISEICEESYVNDAEGALVLPGTVSFGENENDITILSRTDRISCAYAIEGKLPANPDECAVDPTLCEALGISVGDTIDIGISAGRFSEILKGSTYTVTAIAGQPDYLAEGSVCYAILPIEAFDTTDYAFDYTNIFVDIDYDSENILTTGYTLAMEDSKKSLNVLSDIMADEKNATLTGTLEAEYAASTKEAYAGLDEAKNELDAAQEEYDNAVFDAHVELAEKEGELKGAKETSEEMLAQADEILSEKETEYKKARKEAKDKLEAAKNQKNDKISEAQEKIKEAENDLTSTKARLEEKEENYNELVTAYNEVKKSVDISNADPNVVLLISSIDSACESAKSEYDALASEVKSAKANLDELKADYIKTKKEAEDAYSAAETDINKELDKADEEIAEARKLYEDKKADIQDKLDTAQQALDEAKAALAAKEKEGQEKLDDAWAKYNSAGEQVETEIENARSEIDRIEEAGVKWVIKTAETDTGYLWTKTTYETLSKFFLYFAPLYMALMVMVVFFTISITVMEQKKEVGTVKAFGMYRSEMCFKYVVFGVSGAAAGGILGCIGAVYVESLFTGTAVGYLYGELPNILQPSMICILVGGSVLIAGLVAFISCNRLISCSAVGLMNGSEPKKKEIKKSAKSVSGNVYRSLIRNNIYTDRGRVVISIVILIVCTMLIGLGFGAKNSLYAAIGNQIDDVWIYDAEVTLDDDISDENRAAVEDALSSYESTGAYSSAVMLERGSHQTLSKILCVKDTEVFCDFYGLKDMDGNDVSLSERGLLVTSEMIEKDGITQGESITLIDADMNIVDATVAGEFLQYFEKTIMMSEEYYERLYQKTPVYNTYYVNCNTEDIEGLISEISAIKGVRSTKLPSDLWESYRMLIDLYDTMVILVIVLSFLLMIFVSLNLSNILVLHRMRELLTMRVNGFSNGQVIGYLAREMALITALGILLGIIAGIPFTAMLIPNMEGAGIMFAREIYPPGWLMAAISSAGFSVVINAIAFRKVGKIPLTDISKY